MFLKYSLQFLFFLQYLVSEVLYTLRLKWMQFYLTFNIINFRTAINNCIVELQPNETMAKCYLLSLVWCYCFKLTFYYYLPCKHQLFLYNLLLGVSFADLPPLDIGIVWWLVSITELISLGLDHFCLDSVVHFYNSILNWFTFVTKYLA